MRTFVVLLIAAVLGCLFIVQKRHDQNAARAPVATTAAGQKAATPRPVSEHNWAKHAIDRARNVTDQVATQRKEDGVRK
jgi:hypothetical protein